MSRFGFGPSSAVFRFFFVSYFKAASSVIPIRDERSLVVFPFMITID
jgi:hypothetical protein